MEENEKSVVPEQTDVQPTVTVTQSANKNPLAGYFRQPKIYVKLPSGGRFYSEGTLDHSETGDYAVYAMTAKDELMFKTPDALLTGQATVEVIKSCVPAILDPWLMPTVDLDFILVAIRVATYGNDMEVETKCPHCAAEQTYDIDLASWIGSIGSFKYKEHVSIDPLTVEVRPYTYQELTKTSVKTMEQQRVFQTINDDKMSDEEKLDKFGKSFVKLTELSVDIIADCVIKIETPDGPVTDRNMIKEFINNSSKDNFDKIQNHLKDLKEQIEFKSRDVQCGECKETFNLPITMDQSNFFGAKS
jgi:hypothetical protein